MQHQFPKGWKIFPCAPGAKTPVEGFTDWPIRATDDPDQIAMWAKEYPGCNWAVALGPSDLAVIDIDPPLGEDSLLRYELSREPLPPTLEQRSARGGRHLIFRDDLHLCANSVSKLGPKLDTRGQNGYILIAPSVFEGGCYEFTNDFDVADLPDFVPQDVGRAREAVKSPPGTSLDSPSSLGRARRLLLDYVERGDIAIQGQGGDNRTYQVCAEVLNLGLSEGRALELIDTLWNCHCVPPWGKEELASKVANAASYAQNDAGAWAVLPVTEAIPASLLDRLRQEARSASPEPAEHARFHWMAEAEFRHMPPPQWLLPDIFTTNSVNMLYGPSGHYKSFIAMKLGGDVALSGKCAFYVAAEGISRMAAKDYPAWKIAYGVEEEVPFFMTGDMPTWSESEEDYKAFCASIAAKAGAIGKDVGVIFLDTLNRALVGLEENSASEMAQFIRIADKIKQAFKCAVVLVHHTPNDGKGPRGSSALYAGCDTVLRVEADKDTKLVRMWVQKQKTSEEREAPFLYQGNKYGEGLAFTPATQKEAAILTDENNEFSPANIATILALHPDHPLTNHALLSIICQKRPEETDAEYNAFLGLRKKALTAAIKANGLEQFCEGHGEARMWRLKAKTAPD